MLRSYPDDHNPSHQNWELKRPVSFTSTGSSDHLGTRTAVVFCNCSSSVDAPPWANHAWHPSTFQGAVSLMAQNDWTCTPRFTPASAPATSPLWQPPSPLSLLCIKYKPPCLSAFIAPLDRQANSGLPLCNAWAHRPLCCTVVCAGSPFSLSPLGGKPYRHGTSSERWTSRGRAHHRACIGSGVLQEERPQCTPTEN